jgi:hypothetical protein
VEKRNQPIRDFVVGAVGDGEWGEYARFLDFESVAGLEASGEVEADGGRGGERGGDSDVPASGAKEGAVADVVRVRVMVGVAGGRNAREVGYGGGARFADGLHNGDESEGPGFAA